MTADGAGVPDVPDVPDTATLAAQVHAVLRGREQTLAVAESLTGGALGAALTAVPGASETFRGGVLAYASEVKAGLLGVPPELLARVGAVHPEVARLMALGVRDRLATTYGVSTTGVAGSGKSSLIHGSVARRDGIVSIDQGAIRGSRRSNPATYTGLLEPIRKLMEAAWFVEAPALRVPHLTEFLAIKFVEVLP